MAHGINKNGAWRKYIRLYNQKGNNEDGAMTQKAATEMVSDGMYFGEEYYQCPIGNIVKGNRQVNKARGIDYVDTATTIRATAFYWFPIDVMRTYHSIIVPNGFKVSIYSTNTRNKSTSTTAYKTSGWLESQQPEINGYLYDNYPYVCINFKKSDDSIFTDEDIAVLNSGVKLVTYLGKDIKDFSGNQIDGNIKSIAINKNVEELSFDIQKHVIFNPYYGNLAKASAPTRACIMKIFSSEELTIYNKIVVPIGYDFAINSCKNADIYNTTIDLNTKSEQIVDGWHVGDGTEYTIGIVANKEFPFVGINFKRTDDANITDSDIATLAAGVSIYKTASNKGFRFLKVYNKAGNLIGGIYNPAGEADITIVDEKTVRELTGSIGNNTYYGGRIQLKQQLYQFDRKLYKVLPSAVMTQSFAIYGNYMLRFNYNGTTLTAYLYNITNNAYIRSITLNYGNMTIPHCNVACFSRVFASGNSDLPLLYLSQWDGERGCLVYDIHLNGTANLVQVITSNVSASKFGEGQADWVVDYDEGYIYSIAYKIANGYNVTEADGNRSMICKFRLPKLTDGENIVFQDADIVDSYDVPPFNVMQDKCYRNGRILIAAGGSASYNTAWRKLYSLNLGERRVEAAIPIHQFLAKEPEGIDMHGDLLLMDYNDDSQYGYGTLYSYEF